MWLTFYCWKTEIMGSNLTQDVNVIVFPCLLRVLLLCVGAALATVRSHTQGSLQNVYLKKKESEERKTGYP